jgi:hypothetical protein
MIACEVNFGVVVGRNQGIAWRKDLKGDWK